MITLNHVELSDPAGVPPHGEDGTLLRYWQAEVPGTDLYAVTEEACTRNARDGALYMRLTRFFVGTQPCDGQGQPFGGILVQDELSHGNHFVGPIGPAIRNLDGPTPWTDTPRQRMLDEAIAKHNA